MHKFLLLHFFYFCIVSRIASGCNCGLENRKEKERENRPENSIGRLQYPWLAHIKIKTDSGERKGCAGSLVNEDLIVTARDCVFHDGKEINPQNIKVTLGTYQGKSVSGGALSVAGYDFGEVFEKRGLISRDLAVIKLQKKLKLKRKTAPICLPESTEDLTDSKLFVVGWDEELKGFPRRPLQEKLDFISVEKCSITESEADQFLGSNILKAQLGDVSLCAFDIVSKSSRCSGILGSPIMRKNPKTQAWSLVGVVTDIKDCQNKKGASKFTRFDGYRKLSRGLFDLNVPRGCLISYD